ncbi:MAG TPA: S41 family peptidase [Verrucomicrobiae bacterium]
MAVQRKEPERLAQRRKRLGRLCVVVLVSGFGVGWLAGSGCASGRKEPNLNLVAQAWSEISKNYVDRSAVDSTELTYGAIGGMVDALGDTGHSSFLTPEMVKELGKMERGEFKGVGIEIQSRNGQVVVVSPMDGSPAEKAGVHPGDVILRVGGRDVADWPLNRVVQEIAGRPGTKVTLTLLEPRTGRERQLTLVRASIKLHEVTWARVPGTDIAHLRLATFDAGVTRDLRRALGEIRDAGLGAIILDLRNNPGGLLDEAISVASQFLEFGDVLLTRDTRGKVEAVGVEKGGMATSMPLVLLVNEGSASAAEIVAGALQDGHRARLVGQTTFGTGTVLEEFRLSDGSALLLAVQEWLTPSGRSFWHKGIVPDLPLPLSGDEEALFPAAVKSMTPRQLEQSTDRQLRKAIQVVTEDRRQPGENPVVQTSDPLPARQAVRVR